MTVPDALPRRDPRLVRALDWKAAEPYVRLVPQYARLPGIELTTIPTHRIESLASYVRVSRLFFARALLEQMRARQLPLYAPVIIEYDARKRIVIPPVVEKHGDRFILFDGTHRIWAAREVGIQELSVVCVGEVGLPLPSIPVPWERVRVREDYYSTEENLVNFNRALFRPVTTTFNGDSTYISFEEDSCETK